MKEFFTIFPSGKNHISVTKNEAAAILNSAKSEYKHSYNYSNEEQYLYEADTDSESNCGSYSIVIAVKIAGEWQRASEYEGRQKGKK